VGSAATAAHGHEEGDRREHHEHEYDGGYRPPRQGRGGDLVREDRGRGDRVVLTGGVVLPGLEYVPGDGVAGTAGEDRRAHEHGPVELLVEQGRHVTCVGVDRRGLLGVHHHQVHSVVIGVLDDLADTFHIGVRRRYPVVGQIGGDGLEVEPGGDGVPVQRDRGPGVTGEGRHIVVDTVHVFHGATRPRPVPAARAASARNPLRPPRTGCAVLKMGRTYW